VLANNSIPKEKSYNKMKVQSLNLKITL